MKSIRFRLLAAAAAVILVAAVAHAQTMRAVHMQGGERPFGGHMLHFFGDYLNLTDAQQAQIKDILAKERPTMKPLVQQMAETRRQLRTFEQGTFDEAKVRALATQHSQIMTELIVQRARIHSELFQVLTPEQQAKMKEFMANREQRFQRHMHMHGGPPAEPPSE